MHRMGKGLLPEGGVTWKIGDLTHTGEAPPFFVREMLAGPVMAEVAQGQFLGFRAAVCRDGSVVCRYDGALTGELESALMAAGWTR